MTAADASKTELAPTETKLYAIFDPVRAEGDRWLKLEGSTCEPVWGLVSEASRLTKDRSEGFASAYGSKRVMCVHEDCMGDEKSLLAVDAWLHKNGMHEVKMDGVFL